MSIVQSALIKMDTTIVGAGTGLAGSSTVTPYTWNGTALAAVTGTINVDYSVGTIVEAFSLGTYICRIGYAVTHIPPLSVPCALWVINGVNYFDFYPTPCSVVSESGITYPQTMAIILDAVSSKLTGLSQSVVTAGSLTVDDPAGSTTRITTNFDIYTNRTSTVLYPPDV